MAFNFGQSERGKRGKREKVDKEDREKPWKFIESWSDKMFRAQFRLTRADFQVLLQKLISTYVGPFSTGVENYAYCCTRGD